MEVVDDVLVVVHGGDGGCGFVVVVVMARKCDDILMLLDLLVCVCECMDFLFPSLSLRWVSATWFKYIESVKDGDWTRHRHRF